VRHGRQQAAEAQRNSPANARPLRPRDQARHRTARPAEIDLQLCVKLVRDSEIGVQVEGLPERRFSPLQPLFGSRGEVLRHHMVDSPKARPGRRIARIGFHTTQVQIARRAPLFRIVAKLIAA
jgi:hypothetical protein